MTSNQEQKILTTLTKIKKGDRVGRQVSEGGFCQEEAEDDGIHIKVGSHTTFLTKKRINSFLRSKEDSLTFDPWAS